MCQKNNGQWVQEGLADCDCQTPSELTDLMFSGLNENIVLRQHRHSLGYVQGEL